MRLEGRGQRPCGLENPAGQTCHPAPAPSALRRAVKEASGGFTGCTSKSIWGASASGPALPHFDFL